MTIRLAYSADASDTLEAVFVPSTHDAATAVMAPPHPLYGGNLANPVVSEIADACQRTGLASLRFNWRGVGASAGAVSSEPEIGVSDYTAALAYVESHSQGAIVACGYSFGAASGASAARKSERVKALLLVAPPVVMLNVDALKSFEGPVLLVAGDQDSFAPRQELEAISQELKAGELVLLEGTDHYFATGLPQLGRAAEDFLQRVVSPG